MNKKNTISLMVLALLSTSLLAACASSPAAAQTDQGAIPAEPLVPQASAPSAAVANNDTEGVAVTSDEGISGTDQPTPATAIAPQPTGVLSAEEAAGLLYMREEEKLAHDVYLTLYEKWGTAVFQNIAGSEATHTEAVLTLIERYGLTDPAAGNDRGIFADPALQALYNQLSEQGSQSLSGALRVGAAIEEIDILDLEERLGQTDQPDIILVYQNLTAGSQNHLRAFVSVLGQQVGETYQPQYLSQAAFDEIMSSQNGRGQRGGPGN
jgi:hypothetical protein